MNRALRRIVRHALVALTLTIAGVGASAAPPPPLPSLPVPPGPFDWTSAGRLPLRLFTDRDGLPQNAVTSIAFARDGSLWIGTKDGAARYNGRVWTSVPMPEGVRSNWVDAVLATDDGALWFGTRGGGLVGLRDGKWSVFTTKDGLPSLEVRSLVVSREFGPSPALVVGTEAGIARLDGGRLVPVPLPAPYERNVARLFEGPATGPLAGLWIGLRDAVLHLRGGRFETFDLAAAGVRPNNPARAFAITSVLTGSPAHVLSVPRTRLLVLREGRFTPYSLDGRVGMPQALLTARDARGRETLWVAGQTLLVRVQKDRLTYFGEEAGFPALGFWSLAETPEGAGTHAIWIGMAGAGLVRLNEAGWTSFGMTEGLPDSSVYAITESREPGEGTAYWVGTNRGGLVRLAPRRREVWKGKDKAGSNTVLGIYESRPAFGPPALWTGTTGGIGVRRQGRWSLAPTPPDLRGVNATVLVEAASKGPGALWVGTDQGLGLVDSKGAFRSVGRDFELPGPRVTALKEVKFGSGVEVWVGTDRGLRIRGDSRSLTLTAADGLPADAIMSLLETRDARGRWMWVGTRRGAARLSLDDPRRLETFTTLNTEGLPNDTIYQIQKDRYDRLYFFTNKGVARLTPRGAESVGRPAFDIYVFTTEDGLPSNECNTGASLVDSAGRIWVGTIAGLAVLDPVPEASLRSKPLVIEKAQVAAGGALVPGAVLPHDRSAVTFDYALLNLLRDEDTRYRTQLVGLDPQPSAWTADTKKEYTRLPAGSYEFNVWARDVTGALSGPSRLAFSVLPAPWRTWWAYAIYALSLGALLSLAVRYRLRAVRERNEELERLISARTSELAEAVSRLKESEQSALQAKDAALQASRAKSTFLANMSHELRTPLNAVIGFAQVLDRRGAVRAEDRESLRIIRRSGEHLLGLINDVLSLSKIEAGALSLVEKPFDLPALLESVRAIIAPRAEGKGLSLDTEVSARIPGVVTGDEGKLRQVLINLLGNAVKFTRAGGRVFLRVFPLEGRVRFEVQDTGEGMSAEELAGLFTAFAQTESGRAAAEGTGLGLAISREIVRAMGGDIAVESRPGHGSVFHFDLPLLPSNASLDAPDRRILGVRPASAPVRVLVVDDIAENRLLLRQVLAVPGFEVREAPDGAQALALWRTFRPAAVLMDARMPVMDGLEATRKIRGLEAAEGGPRCAIIALTAGAFEHEREEMVREGADDFIAKPFNVGVIFERLARATGIEYVYEETEGDAVGSRDSSPASGADDLAGLRGVDAALLAELRSALETGHARRALAAAERIRVQQPATGAFLASEIQAFRLDELRDAVERSLA